MSAVFDYDRLLHAIAARHRGVITRERAFEDGIPRHVLDDRVEAGVLIVMHDGVYRHAAVPFTQDLRDLAAVLACGADAVLSHRSAAARQYPDVRRSRPEVTSPHTDLPRVDGVTLHRTLWLPPCEVTVHHGIPITTPGRTALDYCSVVPLHIAEEVINAAVITKRLRQEDVFAVLDRSGGRGRRGTAALRVVALGFEDLERLESMLELHVARALDGSGLPRFERQYEMVCVDGRQVRLDFARPDIRFAIEANGRRWHDTPARKKRTRERLASIEGSNWEVMTVGWGDDPLVYLAEAEEVVARRTRRAA